jgi:hypothetical protein
MKGPPSRVATRRTLPYVLHPSDERTKRDGDDREPDQPHGHLDGGWLAGSLAEDGWSQEVATLVEHAYPVS